LLFEGQCSPHAFLINFKVGASHVFILLVPLRPQGEAAAPHRYDFRIGINGLGRRSNLSSFHSRSYHSPVGPAHVIYKATHRPTLVAMPEASQVSSRQKRQCPAERINLTGARTTNWGAFSRYPSARLAAIATDLLGNPHRLSSRSI
jgi:hypothetical protein